MDNPYEENEDMMQARGDYEREHYLTDDKHQFAYDHGYSHYTCKVHGGFWTDSGDGCPSCEPVREEEPEVEEEDALQVALATYHYNLDPINRAAARYAQGESLMSALRGEKVL